MPATVQALGWRWDSGRGVLWGRVQLSDGRRLSVGLPLSEVVAVFDAALLREGVQEPAQIGAPTTVSGLFGKVKRLTRRATRTVRKAATRAVRRTTRQLERRVVRHARRYGRGFGRYSRRYLRPVSRTAKAAARSRALGAALAGTAAVCPAVGGPALGAWMAANRAVTAYDQGQAAARAVRRGVRNPRALAQVRQAQRIRANAMAAARSRHPAARLYAGALRSVA